MEVLSEEEEEDQFASKFSGSFVKLQSKKEHREEREAKAKQARLNQYI